ncbi:MAG: DUF4431 domain-containing protein, partial [Verrucomicrobiota bacterium]|nr:DUF4431 domain-containing protein [Verrucomicrobiota bacterium]
TVLAKPPYQQKANNVTEIQLIIFDDPRVRAELQRNPKGNLAVTGKLLGASTAHHKTPVLMIVEKVQQVVR